MATLTFGVMRPMQPKYGPNRSWNIEQTIITSATWSAGDVYLAADLKIPHGAVITDMTVKGSVPDGTYLTEIGMSNSNGVLDIFGSVTISATAVTNSVRSTALPYTVSVSDDAALRYQTISLRVDGAATSATASTSININVKYYTR